MAVANSPSRSPIKWAVGLTVLLIAYALLQPQLNQRLGWNLPSLTDLQQSQLAPTPPPAESKGPTPSDNDNSAVATAGTSGENSSESSVTHDQAEPQFGADDGLRYGLLRQTGRDEFVSPGGLRYTPGSLEGHRLKHIERHLVDDPNRPGKHGVFDGDMPQVLRWLDEAYALGRRGGRGVSVRREDGRTVYEVRFPKPVGYIGGRDGGRQQHPDARQIRLVLDGDKVITAFPF